MRNKQSGYSLGTLAIVTLVVLYFAYMGIRLFPAYIEYWGILSVMNSVKEEYKNDLGAIDPLAIRKSVSRNFEVNDVKTISQKDVKIAKNKSGGFDVSIDYKREQDFIGNLYLLLKFKHTIQIQGGASD